MVQRDIYRKVKERYPDFYITSLDEWAFVQDAANPLQYTVLLTDTYMEGGVPITKTYTGIITLTDADQTLDAAFWNRFQNSMPVR